MTGRDADFALVQQNLRVGLPVWRNDTDTLTLLAGVRYSKFFTDVQLPDTRRTFPSELWSVSVGSNYSHRFENGWTGSLMLSLVSASDQPFESLDLLRIGAAAVLNVPAANARDSWRFGVMYAPFSDLSFPFPLFSYTWMPSEDLTVNLGIPFSVQWRPSQALLLEVLYLPLFNVNTRATYRLFDRLNVYGGYETLRESYLLTDRAEARDRFLGSEQRVIAGVSADLCRYATLDLNSGYSFQRFFGEGHNQRGNLHDRVDLAPGAFLGASLRIHY